MKKMSILSNSEDETREIGARIAKMLKTGQGILFQGELGTGKTTLISGVCRALGVKGAIKSPTFVIAWVYEGVVPIYHVDLYRLSDYSELENVGWEEMAEESGIYLVEWADRFPLPYTDKAIRIFIDYGSTPEQRKIDIEFDNKIYPELEKELAEYVDTRN